MNYTIADFVRRSRVWRDEGGEGGIRTLEGFDTLRAFQARALDHYATPP